MQGDPSDYGTIQKRIWERLEKGDYVEGARDLEAVVSFLEQNFSTEYIDYIEYLFLLHQVQAEMKDTEKAVETLSKLLFHFQNAVDPRMLSERGGELYLKTWTYLAYLLAELGRKEESLAVFRKSLPILMLSRGADSSELDTVRWYMKSVEKHGHVSSDEPDPFELDEEDEEGLRCSFCRTGQTDIITGPSVYICRNCIGAFNNLQEDPDYCKHLRLFCDQSSCSFQCARTREEQVHLFPGPGVFICGDCVKLCNELDDDRTLPLNN